MKPLRSLQKTRLVLYGYFALLVALFIITVQTEGPTSNITWMIATGKALGILSITMLTAQLLFSSRLRMLETGIGLDTLMVWHRWNAKFLTLFVFLHPPFVHYGPLMQLGLEMPAIIQAMQPGHYMGTLSLALILLTVFVSIYSERMRIPYHWWRTLHYGVYAIILFGFMHGMMVSSNIAARTWVFWWWLFLAIVITTLTIYRFMFRPSKAYEEYRVTRIVQETPDVRSIYLKPSHAPLIYAPGQFAFVRFFSHMLSTEEHHFTLSSNPSSNELSFTVKELGDYTAQLDLLQEGDKALIDGPYGVFSNQGTTGPFVFIAGGVGITPIMSMLRTMAEGGFTEKAMLIYGCRTKTEVVFYEELKELADKFENFTLIMVYSAEEVTGAHHGFITQELLQKEITAPAEQSYFLCGPKPMTRGIMKQLKNLGVPPSAIRTEIFSLK